MLYLVWLSDDDREQEDFMNKITYVSHMNTMILGKKTSSEYYILHSFHV
jgi:hypothetical protein